MPDKIKILYDAVSKDYSVGSFEEFASKLQDETKRRAFYDGVGAEYNLGDYDTFTSKVKKNSGQNASSNGLPSSASGLGTSQDFQKPTSKAPLIYTPEKQKEVVAEQESQTKDLSDRLTKATDAYRASQGEELTEEIQSISQPKEPVVEDELTFTESVSGTFDNFVNSLKGVAPRLSVVSQAALEKVIGKDLTGKLSSLPRIEFGADGLDVVSGRTSDEIRNQAIDNLDYLKSQTQPTAGLIESASNFNIPGLAAGVVDAVGALASTAIPSIVSGGSLLVTEMVGGSLYDYNTAKAEAKGVTTKELYESGDADFGVPAVVGSIAFGLEKVGLKGVQKAINKKLAGKGYRKALLLAQEWNKEGMTEFVQVGLDAANIAIANGMSVDQAAEEAVDAMFSAKGAEAYAKGFVGSGAASGGGRLAKSLLNSKNKKKVSKLEEQRNQALTDLANENIPASVKETLTEALEDTAEKIDVVVNEDRKATESLTDTQKAKVEEANVKIAEAEATIEEGNVSETTKAILEEQKKGLEKEIDEVLKEKPVEEVKADLPTISGEAVTPDVEKSAQAAVIPEVSNETSVNNSISEINGYKFTNTPTLTEKDGLSVNPLSATESKFIAENEIFNTQDNNTVKEGVKNEGGGWYTLPDTPSNETVLYNENTGEAVTISHKKGGRTSVAVSDFLKNNPRNQKEELVIKDKTKDVLDDETDEKIGEKTYQSFKLDFNDGAKAFGKVEDGVAYISGINAPKSEGETVRGTKTYNRVIDKLKEAGIKTIQVGLQSADSRVAIQKLIDNGTLINPRNLSGVSTDQFPTKFDINTNEQETITEETQAEVKEVVADKAVELKTKPNATDKVLKEQKKDMLTQLNEVKDIVFGKRTEPDLIPETIAKVRDLGYEINDDGQVTFEVKGDGTFKIHADNLIDAISEVKKGFPETTDTENKVKTSSSGRVSFEQRARNRGTLEANETNLNNAKENLETAKKSGNKKLQTVFEKEVEREQKIYDEAKRIGLPEKTTPKETKARKDQRPDAVGASVEGKGEEVVFRAKMQEIIKDKIDKLPDTSLKLTFPQKEGDIPKAKHSIGDVAKRGYTYAGIKVPNLILKTQQEVAEHINYKLSDLHFAHLGDGVWGIFIKDGASKGFESEAVLPTNGKIADVPKPDSSVADSGTAKVKSEEPSVSKTNLQTAKEKLKEAKAKLDRVNAGVGIASDPKEKAKAFYDYHVALVEVAKEYISEGITTVQEFAKEIGEKVSKGVQDAWDEANGGKKKTVKDFEEVSSPNEPTDDELELLGITKKEARRIRQEQGEEQYEYDVKSRSVLVAEADRLLAEGYNVPRLIKRISEGGLASDVEVEILRRYFASLTAAINKKPTPELLSERKSLLEALDHLKTRAGRAVQAFDGFIEVEDNLASFLQDEAQYYELSSEEVQELTEKYNKAKEALEKLQAKQEQALAKARNKKAQSKINEVKAQRRASVREDFAEERKALVEDFRSKLRQIRNTPNMVMLPYQNELIALAPFVKKMTESYVRQGVFELSEIVKGIHEEFKGDMPELTEDDVRDIIAGEYTNPRNTKNAKLAQVRDLETQARLERKIEELEAGIVSTKSQVAKKVKSDKILELERQVKEIKRRNPELTYPTRVQARKTWYANQISNLKNEIKEGKYDPIEPPTPVLLDAEALRLKDEYIAFKEQTRLRRAKKEHEALGTVQKNIRRVQQVLALKRLVQTSLDLSIPLRQGVSIMLNPRTASLGVKGYGKMVAQVFNEKEYQRMMFDIRSSDAFLESKDDGIVYTETSSSDPETRDESHPTESFLYKIPYIREPFRASERAAAAWTNYARYELYQRGVKMLLSQGKTRENAKQAYEDMAARVMVDTGRGKIPGIEDKSPSKTDTWIKRALGNMFYGARLMSSTFRKLNPLYYFNPKVDRSVRIQALKDMAGYVSSQIILTTAIAAATGATVSLDWDDPDFLKLRWGKRVIDLSAGQSTYIRTFMRLVNAAYNRASPYVSKEDAEKYSKFAKQSVETFFRNKLAPNTSYGVNAFMGENTIGEKFDPLEIIKIYPMYGDDLVKAFEEGSPLDAAIILPIGISGLGYQEYSKDVRRARISTYIDKNDVKLKSFLKKHQLNITGDINQEVYNLDAGMKVKMTKEQSDKYEKIWADYVISEIKDEIPELEKLAAIDKKHEEDTGYRDKLDAKISAIKSEATKVAKEQISGVNMELLTIRANDKTYDLTPAQIKERKVYYNEFIQENGRDLRDKYLDEGKSLREAEKAVKREATRESKDRILEKYKGDEEGVYNLRVKDD